VVLSPAILNSLLPVFFIIISGYCLRKIKFPGDDFWPGTEKIVYYFLYPALLFSSSAGASWKFYSVGSMVWAILAALFVMTGILLLLRPRLSNNDASFTSVFQGSIRFTSYIGFAAAFSLFGNQGLYLAAVFITVMIPMVNILCVMVLVSYGGQKGGWHWILVTVIKNPLIIACLAGMAFNLLGLQLPELIANLATILGRGSLPLGLLAVGASLQINTIKSTGYEVVYACLLKLALMPFGAFCGSARLALIIYPGEAAGRQYKTHVCNNSCADLRVNGDSAVCHFPRYTLRMVLLSREKDTFSLAALIGANLIPFAGVFFFGWDVSFIVLLYWLENLIVGFYNILKMATVKTTAKAAMLHKLFVIPFFCIHYGGFCAVHGVFLTVFFKIGTGSSPLAGTSNWWGPLVFL
jgi:predicted permease